MKINQHKAKYICKHIAKFFDNFSSNLLIGKVKILSQFYFAGFVVVFSCSQMELKPNLSFQGKRQRSFVKFSKGKKVVWRGLVVADEDRCTPYNRDDYRYSQGLEKKIVERNLGGRHYSPYTGKTFRSLRESQIEHIVSTGEAHRSGLCAADAKTRLKFASDMDNLTLASKKTNRQKWDKDAAGWIPPESKCWFARTVIKVKRKYGLTVDREEVWALDGILKGCTKG